MCLRSVRGEWLQVYKSLMCVVWWQWMVYTLVVLHIAAVWLRACMSVLWLCLWLWLRSVCADGPVCGAVRRERGALNGK